MIWANVKIRNQIFIQDQNNDNVEVDTSYIQIALNQQELPKGQSDCFTASYSYVSYKS